LTSPLQLVGEKLRVKYPALEDGKETHLPLPAVALIWFAAPEGAGDAEMLRRKLIAEKRARDLVLLRNGDVLEGVLDSLDEQKVRVEVDKKTATVSIDRVAAIALNTELAAPLRPRGVHARAVLADGARLSLASAECDGETLTGTTLNGARVRLPVEQLVSLDFFQGCAVYLSDLTPAKYEHTPYLDVTWPLVADGSVTRRALRLGGSVYDKGLGLHSACRVTYRLDGNYRRFEALVGLDSETGKKGSARVGVLVDGKPRDLGIKDDLTIRTAPLPVRIDVTGAKELTLVVEFGRRGDAGDHVNWAEARLIKGDR
jgi:hypothetical protein